MNQNSAKFLSGCIVERDTFFLSSRLDALPDGEYFHARISACRFGEFFFQDRKMEVSSVCMRRENKLEPIRASCVLARDCSVVGLYEKGAEGPKEETLPSTSPGVMHQIASIDNVLYAVGSGGNVFKRTISGWVQFNEGLNTKSVMDYESEGLSRTDALSMHIANQTHLNSICGIGGNLYTAGKDGKIFFRSQNFWNRISSDTNAWIFRLFAADEENIFAVGRGGVVLKGNSKGFKTIETVANEWFDCITEYRGEIYIGGSRGLYKLIGNVAHKVKTNQNKEFSCVALDAYNDQLLVVCERWILVYDGNSWTRIDNPDNSSAI